MNLVGYALVLMVTFSIYLLVTVGLNLIAGYCGRLSLAHGALYGAGAYAYAIVGQRMESAAGPLVALLSAVIAGALLSVLLAIPERRLRGDFFIIATLAFQAIMFGLFKNWHSPGEPIGSMANLTNGTAGIAGVQRPELFTGLSAFALLSLVCASVGVAVVLGLVRSPWGRLVQASRDDRLVAEGLGKDVLRVRCEAFAVAGGAAGLAGALYAAYSGYVSPDLGSVDRSVLFLCMVLIGGRGSLKGPIVGAAAMLFLEESLRQLEIADRLATWLSQLGGVLPFFDGREMAMTDANLQLLVYGLLLALLLRVRPHGMAGDPATIGE